MQPPLRRATGLLLLVALAVSCSGPAPTRTDDSSSRAQGRTYHVQLQLTDDKERAVEILGAGQRWWSAQSPATRPPLVNGTDASEKAVSIEWKAPYYRVRLGPFATEAQAETVLAAARDRFPDAFVVPDRVEGRTTDGGGH